MDEFKLSLITADEYRSKKAAIEAQKYQDLKSGETSEPVSAKKRRVSPDWDEILSE
jgi:hypothetical protein